MIAYRATLDVFRELVPFVADLLRAERRRRGTRTGTRALTCFWQAVLVLRWFRDRTNPAQLMHDLRLHFDIFVRSGPEAFVFTGARGAQLRRSTFQRHWRKGLTAAGLTGKVHFHDLRHTGNTWAAESGATLRELMDRMGHASTRAALIYIHSRDDRDRSVAQAISDLVAESLRDEESDGEDLPEASGT